MNDPFSYASYTVLVHPMLLSAFTITAYHYNFINKDQYTLLHYFIKQIVAATMTTVLKVNIKELKNKSEKVCLCNNQCLEEHNKNRHNVEKIQQFTPNIIQCIQSWGADQLSMEYSLVNFSSHITGGKPLTFCHVL